MQEYQFSYLTCTTTSLRRLFPHLSMFYFIMPSGDCVTKWQKAMNRWPPYVYTIGKETRKKKFESHEGFQVNISIFSVMLRGNLPVSH